LAKTQQLLSENHHSFLMNMITYEQNTYTFIDSDSTRYRKEHLTVASRKISIDDLLNSKWKFNTEYKLNTYQYNVIQFIKETHAKQCATIQMKNLFVLTALSKKINMYTLSKSQYLLLKFILEDKTINEFLNTKAIDKKFNSLTNKKKFIIELLNMIRTFYKENVLVRSN